MENLDTVNFLNYVISQMVNHPEDVKIQKVEGTRETIIEIRVHQEDMGKIIGKNGSVIRALKTIAGAVGSKEKKNYNLELVD